jgi:FG-GAP repeat
VLVRAGEEWIQQGGKLIGGGEEEGAAFGSSVALSGEGNTALIGGPHDAAGHGVGTGAAWVFTRTAGKWTQQGSKFTYSGPKNGPGAFGLHVALSDDANTALVGTPGQLTSGAAWVFTTRRPPDFGRCLKVASGTGTYATAKCTTSKTSNSYEWYPAVGSEPLQKTNFATAIKPLTKLLLETKGKEKIYCTGQTGTGEYDGVNTIENVTLKLTGCYKGPTSDHCQGSLTPHEINFLPLYGRLGIVKEEAEASKDKIGIDLKPASGEVIAQFECESTALMLKGSVILEGKANSMLSSMTLKAAQSHGIQKWTHFVGGKANEDTLEAKIGAGSFEQAGLSLTTVQTNEEKVEVNSVF